MSARKPELLPDIIFDIDPAYGANVEPPPTIAPAEPAMLNIETTPQPSDLNVKQPNAADVKHRSLENAKQSNPATEVRMLNKSENVKQRHDPIVKQSSSPAGRMSYLGVRIPPELLGAIDAMAGSRSKTVRELLQFALDVKQRGK